MELFKLFGRVLVETSDADKNLDKTDGKAKDLTSDLGSAMKSVATWAASIGTAVVACGTAIANIVSDVAARGDEIDKASQKLGVSAQFYQEWAYILERNGTTMDSVGEAIFELSQKVGEADESILETLERIGIGVNDALTMTPEDLWEAVIDGLMKIDSESERAAISTRLLGDKAKQLGPLLNSGAEATKDLKDRFHDLGGVMSDTVVKLSADYADAQTDFKVAFEAVKYHLAEKTLPGMTLILKGFTDFLAGDFSSAMENVGTGIKTFLDGILVYASEWRTKLEEYLRVEIGLGPVLDSPLNPFLSSSANIEKRNQKLDDMMSEYEAAVEDAGGTWNYTKDFLSDVLSGLKSFVESAENNLGADVLTNENNKAATEKFGYDFFSKHFGDPGKFAVGLPFVPKDNYPALLHYGERVLTRQEAEGYNQGAASGGFNQTNYISTVAQSPAQTAAAIRAAFETARWGV